MSLDVRRAVIESVRYQLGVEVHVERPDTDPGVTHGWLRTPVVSPAAGGATLRSRSGALILDLWGDSQGELDDLYARLGWMDGHTASYGSARRIVYTEQSWSAVPEAGRWHGTLTWSVSYVDARPSELAMPP